MPRGALIGLRPSMIKFESATRNLEVCTHSRCLPVFVNRQVILALITLGVPDSVFMDMYTEFVRSLDQLLQGGAAALAVRSVQYLDPARCCTRSTVLSMYCVKQPLRTAGKLALHG